MGKSNQQSSGNCGSSTGGRKSEQMVVSGKRSMKNLSEKLKSFSESELIELKSVQSILSALLLTEDENVVARDDRESGEGREKSKEGGGVKAGKGGETEMGDERLGEEGEEKRKQVWWSGESFWVIWQSMWENVGKSFQKHLFIPQKPSKSNIFGMFFLLLAFIFYFELHTSTGFTRMWLKWENVDMSSVECTIESPSVAMEWFRPPVSCSFCENITSADRVRDISPYDFEQRYAYSGKPVVITDAMANWTASKSFAFSFFKNIYVEGSRSLEHQGEDCLFFPYVTEFRNLAEVFNMTGARYQKPWYIGWSNCDAETSHILRQHYQRPYFLPPTAESTHADWIFMGTPGYGAHMHIDHVINPSWQAQITGKKRWFLLPPPECYWSCESFEIDVLPGEIIVLDTNKWYHQTLILSGDMSITIGSEYD